MGLGKESVASTPSTGQWSGSATDNGGLLFLKRSRFTQSFFWGGWIGGFGRIFISVPEQGWAVEGLGWTVSFVVWTIIQDEYLYGDSKLASMICSVKMNSVCIL